MAQGSHTTRGDYPGVCCAPVCLHDTRKLVMSGKNDSGPLWFEETAGGAKLSYHFDCHAAELDAARASTTPR